VNADGGGAFTTPVIWCSGPFLTAGIARLIAIAALPKSRSATILIWVKIWVKKK
jgi:hypothetical protein